MANKKNNINELVSDEDPTAELEAVCVFFGLVQRFIAVHCVLAERYRFEFGSRVFVRD